MSRILISGGTVIDGLRSLPRDTSVLVEDDRIIGIGAEVTDADEVLDATGCIVAPGFVDIHSHSDYTLLVDPTAQSAIRQGVTTEVVGNCGFGCFPVTQPHLARYAVYGYREGLDHFFDDAGGYYDAVDAVRPAVNVASLVPNGQLRMATGGMKAGELSPDERRRALRLLEVSLEAGAWGYSTGLEYPAERGSTEDEIGAFCEVAARYGTIYATHTRYRDAGSAAAVEEAIRTARKAGVALEVSHLLPRNFAEEGHACLECAERAIAAGDPLHFDMHTRTFGITTIASVLPPSLLQLPPNGLAEALNTAAGEAEVRRYESMFTAANWSKVVLYDSKVFPQFARRPLDEIAASMGTDGIGAMIGLIRAAPTHVREHYVLRPMYQEADLFSAFRHPRCMPGSDATTLSPTGPLESSFFHGAYSWAAWYLRSVAMENSVLSLADAIHQITALPCSKLGIQRRGALVENNFADIVVFDPGELRDQTSVFEPNRLATGIRHLVVNGTTTIRDFELTRNRGGRALRRGSH